MWKLQDFSVTQILREIIFEESRSSKTVIFAILGALSFANLVNFSFQKVQKFIKIKIQSLEIKMADFALIESLKSFSCKI